MKTVSLVKAYFDFAISNLFKSLQREKESFNDMGIDFEEKAFYDIINSFAIKYDFIYPDDKFIELAKEVKKVVDDKSKYISWTQSNDIKA